MPIAFDGFVKTKCGDSVDFDLFAPAISTCRLPMSLDPRGSVRRSRSSITRMPRIVRIIPSICSIKTGGSDFCGITISRSQFVTLVQLHPAFEIAEFIRNLAV